MILATIQIADVKIHIAHTFAKGHMRGCQTDKADAIRMEEHHMILVASARPAVVIAREKTIHNAGAVGIEIVTYGRNGLAAYHLWCLVKIVIAEAHFVLSVWR